MHEYSDSLLSSLQVIISWPLQASMQAAQDKGAFAA